jgi:hypothetical protein
LTFKDVVAVKENALVEEGVQTLEERWRRIFESPNVLPSLPPITPPREQLGRLILWREIPMCSLYYALWSFGKTHEALVNERGRLIKLFGQISTELELLGWKWNIADGYMKLVFADVEDTDERDEDALKQLIESIPSKFGVTFNDYQGHQNIIKTLDHAIDCRSCHSVSRAAAVV